MPRNIEISFDMDFSTDGVLPIPLGRIHLGPYGARLVFCPDGRVRMGIDKRAVEEKYLILYEGLADQLLGFPPQGY